MPQVKMKKTIQIAQYEPLDFEITLSGDDLPRREGEELKTHMSRLQLEVYKQTLAFQVFHGQLNVRQAAQEIQRFKNMYRLQPQPSVNGAKVAG